LAGFLVSGFFFAAFFVRGGGADERSTFGLYAIDELLKRSGANRFDVV
jgi:hypothetical protein